MRGDVKPDRFGVVSSTDLIDAWYAAVVKTVYAAEALEHLAKLLRLKANLPEPWAAPVEATDPAPAAPMSPTEWRGSHHGLSLVAYPRPPGGASQ